MTFRSIADVLEAERRLREGGGGGVIVTVVRSAHPQLPASTRFVVLEGGALHGVGIRGVNELVLKDALERLREGRSAMRSYLLDGGVLAPARLGSGDLDLFYEVLARPPELLIVGAGHIAVPLARIGSLVGFEVTVLDDRPEYATAERFPTAARILVGPYAETLAAAGVNERTYIVLVTRGHVHDQACLDLTIDGPAAYIGMIGSRRRVRTVLATLSEKRGGNVPARHVYAPIGLDIGAATPEEIAVAIVAEIISVRAGREARSLSRGRVHA